MKTLIQRLYDRNGRETGAIVSAILGAPTTTLQKNLIEGQLILFAFNQLYPMQGLNIYREMYVDTPSITVIMEINSIEIESVDI